MISVTTVDKERIVSVHCKLSDGTVERGTGYLVTPDRLVTAWHCTVPRGPSKGQTVDALEIVRFTGGATARARVRARSRRLDLALLTVDTGGEPGWPGSLSEIEYGRIDPSRTPEIEECALLGFPSWNADFREGRLGTIDIADIRGSIRPVEGCVTGEFVLRDHNLSSVQNHQGREDSSSPWSGLSGAMVFYGDLAIGIVVEHSELQGAASLRLRAFYPSIELGKSSGLKKDYEKFWKNFNLPHLKDATIARQVPLVGVKNRAKSSFKQDLDMQINQLGGPDEWVKSAIFDAWENWLSAPSWCSQIEKRLKTLELDSEFLPRAEAAATDRVTYPTILREVRKVRKGRLLERSTNADKSSGEEAAQALAWLAEQEQNPRYGRCFSITGRWGSGKSRVLVEISERFRSAGRGYVLFPKFGAQEVASSVCASVNSRFNTEIVSVDELIDFVETYLRDDLLVVIDDLNTLSRNNSEFLPALRGLIESLTRSTRIRWLIAAQSGDLDAVLSSSNGEFWVEYATLDKSIDNALPEISGWQDLDHANAVGEVGFKIMERHAPLQGREEREVITRERRRFSAEYMTLAQPGVGWLRAQQLLDGSARPGLYADLNEANYVNVAWRKRLENEASLESPLPVIEKVAAGIGRFCAFAKSWPMPESSLVGWLTRRTHSTRSEVVTSISDLVRVGLLERQSGSHFGDEGMLLLKEDSFWGLRLAQAFTRSLEDDASCRNLIEVVEKWLRQAAPSEALTWSTLQFVAAGVSSSIDDPELYGKFARHWLRSSLPYGAILQGALAGNSAVHDHVFPALRRKNLDTNYDRYTLRDRFALLRFVGACCSEVKAAPRFGRLQAHYSGIGEDGLSTYARFVLGEVLSDEYLLPPADLVSVLHSLVGSEEAGIASTAASGAESAGYRGHGNDLTKLIDDIITFMGSKGSGPLADSIKRADNLALLRVSRDDYVHSATFWEELIDFAAERAVRERGIDAMSFLASRGWYGLSGVWSAEVVERSLIGSVTRALGRAYRAGDREYRASYVKLVERMTFGKVPPLTARQCRREAVYLIRHSEVTRGRRGVVVDSVFNEMIRSLASNAYARRTKHLRALCARNDIGYPDSL